MARAAAGRGKGKKPAVAAAGDARAQKPVAKKKKPPSYEEQLFFSRLRNHTKWMFAALAIVFALSFVVLGVGSGSGGVGDFLSNGFNSVFGTSSSDPVAKAQKDVKAHPKDAQAWLRLATALSTRSRTDEAITAMERYTALQPRDVNGLRQLAILYNTKAGDLSTAAQVAQIQAGSTSSDSLFAAVPTNKGASVLPANPLATTIQSAATTEATTAVQKAQDEVKKAIAVYERIATLSPKDAGVQVELAQFALNSGDVTTALAAFRKALALDPNGQYAAAIRKEIKQLTAPPAAATPTPSKPKATTGGTTKKK